MWPELHYDRWRQDCQSLHRWAQIVGKIRLSESPWVNHGWSSTLYVTERGLTTSVIHHPALSFSIELDLVAHLLRINPGNELALMLPLISQPVASFYSKILGALASLGIRAHIHGRPNELPDDLPFAEDQVHRTYDAQEANAFFLALTEADRLMKLFRAGFVGKCSPVHFFWGSMDLAVTRFSGRRAPEHPGGFPHLPDLITREAYSHEVSSCGFWPGNERYPQAAFYSYAYPVPAGFERARMPKGAFFHDQMREFLLPYDSVRASRSPDDLVLEFFQRSYEAAADFGKWDRDLLEDSPYLAALQARRIRAINRAA